MFTSEDYDMLDDERATMQWERHCDGLISSAEYRTILISEGYDVDGFDYDDLVAAYDEVFGTDGQDVF